MKPQKENKSHLRDIIRSVLAPIEAPRSPREDFRRRVKLLWDLHWISESVSDKERTNWERIINDLLEIIGALSPEQLSRMEARVKYVITGILAKPLTRKIRIPYESSPHAFRVLINNQDIDSDGNVLPPPSSNRN